MPGSVRFGGPMVEILKCFEQVASRFSPAVLVLPGLAMVLLGLVTWLAGMCLRRIVPGLIGAMAGGMAGFFFGEAMAQRIREEKLVIVPECTGVWWMKC